MQSITRNTDFKWGYINTGHPVFIKKNYKEQQELQHELNSKEVGRKLGVKLGVNEVKIYQLMIETPDITIIQLSDELNLSTTAVENNIKKLKEKGAIDREGSDKTGLWKILIQI